MNKKGQAVSIGSAPALILGFVLMVLIAGAGAIALNSFKGTTTASSYAYNITADGESGLNNFSDQVPTVGTILGVGLIIVVVVGAFAYIGLRRMGGI